MKIVCVFGLIGSGKGAVSDYLVSRHGYTSFSTGNLLREIAKKKGLKVTREVASEIFKEYEKKQGKAWVVKEFIQKIKTEGIEKAVFEGIRAPEQVEEIRKQLPETVFLLVSASTGIRFKRMVKRARIGDPEDISEFRKQEKQDKTQFNLDRVFSYKSHEIKNNSDLETLHRNIERFVEEFSLA